VKVFGTGSVMIPQERSEVPLLEEPLLQKSESVLLLQHMSSSSGREEAAGMVLPQGMQPCP
jgi:hypothetical protein